MARIKKRRIRTLDDLVRLIASIINQLEHDEIPVDRGRAIISAASVMRQVLESSDIEARLAALEESQGHVGN